MQDTLNEVEIHILGCLVEKELTTPEYYPLTLNSLTNACNQKSNRNPVVSYDQETVAEALRNLRERRLAIISSAPGQRVRKYEHRFRDSFFVSQKEMVVMCELMLRGPQTIGELRTHGSRMIEFAGLPEISEILEELSDREQPLVTRLPRQPGRKENRFAHLLAGEPDIPATEAGGETVEKPAADDQVQELKKKLGHSKRKSQNCAVIFWLSNPSLKID